MEIQKVIKRDNYYIVNDQFAIPHDESNAYFKQILEWKKNGGVIEEFQHNIKEGKASKIQETKTKRDIFLNSNIIVSTGEYKATQTAKNLFFNAINGRIATQFPMLWRLADDVTWVSLLKDDAYELYDALEARQTSGFQQESVFIRSINNAQTIEEVNAIIIEFR